MRIPEIDSGSYTWYKDDSNKVELPRYERSTLSMYYH